MAKKDRFKEQVENNLIIFRNELCPYEYNIKASDTKEMISINIYSYEENLPHLLGLQEIAPYIKGIPGINVIEKGKISKGRLFSSVKNPIKRKHVIDKNKFFRYVPLILSISTPLYIYKNKKTALFDSDFLLVKPLKINDTKSAYIHIGIKGTNKNRDYILNSVLVTYNTEDDYDIYFNGQPFYIIEKITKTNIQTLNGEITYLQRDSINISLAEKVDYLKKEKVKITSKLVKCMERIDRKTDRKNTIDDIKKYYLNIDTIEDARMRNLIKDTYFLLEK
ncbi:hypothetical protein ACEE21_10305 [Clostridium baratii]|uniref:hypothetical protein n=1 Tax=Clostridium baratii TaxID=1561 RepID=UPI002A760810|nr:hypothetical protein [Clostridium baratii]MDY3208821.1 hypothetical protein [Clostridium baratii]